MLQLTNSKGTPITNILTWEDAFKQVAPAGQWKPGRSAFALAQHFSSYPSMDDSDGIKKLTEVLGHFGYKDVSFTKGEIEHESRFDRYRNGRRQDLALWGSADGIPLSVFIEAKVDEPFGGTLKEELKAGADAKGENTASMKFARICALAEFFGLSLWEDGNACGLRYQLLTWLAGSIFDSVIVGRSVLFLPVMVYKTREYDPAKGQQNRDDYVRFMETLHFERCDTAGVTMFVSNFLDAHIVSAYVEI